MSIALALVTLDCGSQFRELSVSALVFVFDTLAFKIRLVGRSLALEWLRYELELGLIVCV